MLRAFAVAGEQILAAEAAGRQRAPLVRPETDLPVGFHHRADILVLDVAQPVFRIHEVVAGIQVAVVFDDRIAAARLRVRAGSGHHATPVGQGGVEQVDKAGTDVVPHPLVEDVAHESAETDVADGPGGQLRAFGGRVDDERPGALDRLAFLVHRIPDMLDDRHELHVTAPQAFQELIDLQSAALAVLVDRGHRVERDPTQLQQPQARHHAVEGGSPGLVLPVPVVDVLRSVDRDADQKTIPAEKLRPFRRDERPVRLEGVMDGRAPAARRRAS